MKKKFFDLRLLKHLTIPDMRQLGFEIQEQIKEALSRKEILNKHE